MMAPAVAALAAITLTCTGRETTGVTVDGRATGLTQEPVLERYRIDLQQSRWCRDACAETAPLGHVDDNTIEFERVHDDARHASRSAWTDRKGGAYVRTEQVGDRRTSRLGTCRRTDLAGEAQLPF